MKRAALLITVVAAVVVAVGWFSGWRLDTGSNTTLESREFTTPQRQTVASTVLATGSIRLRVGAEVRVGSQLSGIVEKLNVTIGSRIKKGDVIARIDSRGLEARLARENAQIKVVEQEVRRAEVELARAQKLDAQQLTARTDVEDGTLALLDAQARLERARRDTAVVETDLTYATIRAPISGTVASVTTQEGETVAASFTTPTFVTIIEDNALELVALVDETDIGNVVPGNTVAFTVEAFPTEEFEGQVDKIAPKGTIISGVVNFEVMIRIDRPLDILRPDMTANVSIRTAEREALVLPSQAVLRDNFERFVYVERGSELTRRSVTVGTRQAGFTEIRQGLDPDDRVLISPLPDSDQANRSK